MKKGDRYNYDGTWFEFDHVEYFGRVSIRLAHEHDDTAHEHVDYDPRCTSCYLNQPHSGLVHRNGINRYVESHSIPTVILSDQSESITDWETVAEGRYADGEI